MSNKLFTFFTFFCEPVSHKVWIVFNVSPRSALIEGDGELSICDQIAERVDIGFAIIEPSAGTLDLYL